MPNRKIKKKKEFSEGSLKYIAKCSVLFYGKKIILARQFVLDSLNFVQKIQIENNSKRKEKY